VFRVVSESWQINFVRCYANCPNPGDVLILIIESTLLYGVSSRSFNLEICFLSFRFSIRPFASSFVLLLFQSIYSPSSSEPHDMFNVECNLKDNLSVQLVCPFGVWKLLSWKLSDWKHRCSLWIAQNTTRLYIIYIQDSETSEVYSIILDYSQRFSLFSFTQ